MVRTITAGTLAFVCAWGLTACGGGGGGSSSSDDRTPTQRPSDVDVTLDPGGYAEQQASIESKDDTDDILDVYAAAERTYLLGEDVDNAVASLPKPSISGNKLTYECDNGGRIVITVNNEGASDDERWRFNNCALNTDNFGRIVLNGDYFYVNEVASNGNTTGFQFFDLTGTVVADNDAIVVKGLDEWDRQRNGDERTETYRTDALEFRVGTEYFAIANALTTLQFDSTGVVVTLESKLIGSAINGYINISTTDPVFVPTDETCPRNGLVRLSGGNNTFAEIRYLDDTGTGVVAEVRIDNSGEAVPYDTCESLIF